MKIIAIIPAYNEEKRIEAVIRKTKKYVKKVIVVDDGSTDHTFEVAQREADSVLRHLINMGKGVALKTGISAALDEKPDIVVILDGDGQHDPKDIPKLVARLVKQRADIAIGSRQLGGEMPAVLRIGNSIIRSTFAMLFGKHIQDTQSGFRAFTANACSLLQWQSTRYEVETEILINALRRGMRVVESPIRTVYLDRHKGTTVVDGMKIIARMVCWRMKWYY